MPLVSVGGEMNQCPTIKWSFCTLVIINPFCIGMIFSGMCDCYSGGQTGSFYISSGPQSQRVGGK